MHSKVICMCEALVCLVNDQNKSSISMDNLCESMIEARIDEG